MKKKLEASARSGQDPSPPNSVAMPDFKDLAFDETFNLDSLEFDGANIIDPMLDPVFASELLQDVNSTCNADKFQPSPRTDAPVSPLSDPTASSRTSDAESSPQQRAIINAQSCNEKLVIESATSRDDIDALRYQRGPGKARRRRLSNAVESWLTALHIAAASGHEKILSMLLDRGQFNVNERDGEGKTALHHAVRNNHEACAQLLLTHGADSDTGDFITGWTSLHWAVLNKNENILRMILNHERGNSEYAIDAHDVTGWTPLHVAIERGFEAGVTILLECGADLSFKANRCTISGAVLPREVEEIKRAALLRKREAEDSGQT